MSNLTNCQIHATIEGTEKTVNLKALQGHTNAVRRRPKVLSTPALNRVGEKGESR
jgi:hypothetical protein